jgi:hypothetical protein
VQKWTRSQNGSFCTRFQKISRKKQQYLFVNDTIEEDHSKEDQNLKLVKGVIVLPKNSLGARVLAFGVLFGMLGFSFALATSSRSVNEAATAESRAVGNSALRFTAPVLVDQADPLPDTFDLGDATYGTSITRYLSVTGGVRPYRMVSGNLVAPTLSSNSTFALGASGWMAGSIAVSTVSPLTFTVTGFDSTGTLSQQLSGSFIINVITLPTGTFRFAVDRANNGLLGQHYVSKLETIGGNTPVRYAVLPGSLTVNGVAKGVEGSLEAIGLSLAEDGTIYGRPLEAGLISFTARATDGRKRVATQRNSASAVADQQITLTVENSSATGTDYSTFACSVKGDKSKTNKDTIKFAGNVNLGGDAPPLLNGSRFAFRIGGASYEGVFDSRGQVVSTRGGPLVFADGSKLKVVVNGHTGQLVGSLTNANLSRLLGADSAVDRSTKRLAVGVFLFSKVLASDVIDFSTRISGNKFAYDFKLGKVGSALGGTFQLLNVKGMDRATVAGESGDAWAVKFLAVPRAGIESSPAFDAISSIGVRIGSRYENRIAGTKLLSSGSGAIQYKAEKTAAAVVTSFTLDPRTNVGALTTNPLSIFSTGIPTAYSSTANSVNFSMALDIDRTGNNGDFFGENSKALFNKAQGPKHIPGNFWTDQGNTR